MHGEHSKAIYFEVEKKWITPQTPYLYISHLNILKLKSIHNRTDWTSRWNNCWQKKWSNFFWEKNIMLLSLWIYDILVCNYKVNVSRPSYITRMICTFRPILHHVMHKNMERVRQSVCLLKMIEMWLHQLFW